MACNRLEKIGTIYSRINGLIRSGAMKLEDRPLWYDVYQAFPPKYPPRFDRPAPDTLIKQIFYPEDVLRAKFYKKMRNRLPAMNMINMNQTLCQKCIQLCFELQRTKDMSLEEAFDSAFNRILTETKQVVESNNSEVRDEEALDKPIKVDIKNIFNE